MILPTLYETYVIINWSAVQNYVNTNQFKRLLQTPQYKTAEWPCTCSGKRERWMAYELHIKSKDVSSDFTFLSYQVLIYTAVNLSTRWWNTLPKNTTSKRCPNVEMGETWHLSEKMHQAGIGTEWQAADFLKRHALYYPLCHVPLMLISFIYIRDP